MPSNEDSGSKPKGSIRILIRLIVIGLAYYFSNKISFLFPDDAGSLMAIWPAGGIGLAALLLTPKREWPVISLVLFFSGTTASLFEGRPVIAAIGYMVANVLESLICAHLILHWCKTSITFARVKEILALLLAATAGNACTAFVGAAVAAITSHSAFWHFYGTWFVADGLGILLIAPLIVCWQPQQLQLHRISWFRLVEATILTASAGLFANLTFGPVNVHFGITITPYMLLGIVAWAALRFRLRGASMIMAIVAAIALHLTLVKSGNFPLGGAVATQRLLMVQIYLGVVGASGMLLAASRSEQESATKLLSESQAQYFATFHSSAMGMILNQVNGPIFEVNEAACEILGYTRDELVGRSFRELDIAANPGEQADFPSELQREAGRKQFDAQVRRKSGEIRDVMIASEWAEMNGTTCLLTSLADVSARKRAEEALRASENNLSAFFNTVDDLAVAATLDGQILFANKALKEKLGYTPEELGAMHLLQLHPAELRQEAESIFAAMFRGERSTCPLPLRTKNGDLLPVETRAWFGEWNGLKCILGLCKDLTVEQEAHQRFERLFQHNPALMAMTNLPERRFSDVNEIFLKTLGYSRDEVIGKTAEELGLFIMPSRHEVVSKDLRESGHVCDVELQVRCKDGRILDGLFSGDLISSQGKSYFLTVMIDITSRKQAGRALLDSEAKLAKIFNSSSNGMVFAEYESGKILDVNSTWIQETGIEREVAIGKNAIELGICVDWMNLNLRLAELEHEGRFRDHECELLVNSRKVPYLASAEVIELQNKRYTLWEFKNIAERKQVEEALLASEARLRAVLESSVDAIGVHIDGIWEMCNPAAVKLFGVACSQDLIGSSILNVIAPEERTRIRAYAKNRAQESGAPSAYITRGLRADGTEFDLDVKITSFNLEGKTYILVVLRDITEVLQAEEALRREATFRRSIIHRATEGLCVCHPVPEYPYLRFTIWNERMRQITGYSLDEINQRGWYQTLYPDLDVQHRAEMRMEQMRNGQDLVAEEWEIRRADGQMRTISISTTALEPDGNSIPVLALMSDITERRQSEEALRELHTSAARDAQIKAELVKEINHRVKNNLTSILGLLVSERKRKPEGDQPFVNEALDRLSNRVRSLLDVHQMLAESQWGPVRVTDLAEHIIQGVIAAAPGLNPIALVIEKSPMHVSPRQAGNLALVFNELATNSIKHMSAQRPLTTIRIHVDQDDGFSRIVYRDDGPGYPGSVLCSGQKAVGLGLVKQLVTESLRGELILTNESGAIANLRIKNEEAART